MAFSLLPEFDAQPEKLPRRERQNLLQRGEILQAALRLFSENGYQNVSMNDIAKEAEFGMGTLYKYFDNKEELYKALINGVAEKFHHAVLQALEDERNPLLALKQHIAVRRELFFDNLPVVRLYFAETRGAGFNIKAGFDAELLRHHDEFIEKLASVFERGIKENVFRALDPYHMALALDGIMNTFLFRAMKDPTRFQEGDKLSIAEDIFLEGVMRK
ncbi:MAG: TetR/AcrR family transcriptional regulator [Pseudomonadota bacterium]